MVRCARSAKKCWNISDPAEAGDHVEYEEPIIEYLSMDDLKIAMMCSCSADDDNPW